MIRHKHIIVPLYYIHWTTQGCMPLYKHIGVVPSTWTILIQIQFFNFSHAEIEELSADSWKYYDAIMLLLCLLYTSSLANINWKRGGLLPLNHLCYLGYKGVYIYYSVWIKGAACAIYGICDRSEYCWVRCVCLANYSAQEALDPEIQSELIFVNDMVHLPYEWNFGRPTTLPLPATPPSPGA